MQVSEALIKKVIKENRKAQLELYRQCFSTLMSVTYRYKKNEEDAAALANMAFLKVVSNIARYKKEVPFEAWVRRITINVAIDDYRANRKQQEIFEVTDEIDYQGEVDYNEIATFIEAEDLNEMLLSLPPATRTVFNLYAIDGFSHKEIMEELGISLETSKWHVKEARKKLKKILIQRAELSEAKK